VNSFDTTHHHPKLAKAGSSSSSSGSEKHISFNLGNNKVNGAAKNSGNDLKIATSFCQDPTTPSDKLNTPRTVTVNTSFFPPSSPLTADHDLSSGLTGILLLFFN
jgi:hypothetical protein